MKRVRFSAFSSGESDYGPCEVSFCLEDERKVDNLDKFARDYCWGCNGLQFRRVLGVEENASPHVLEVVYGRINGIDFEYCASDPSQFTELAREEAVAFALLMHEWEKAKEPLSHWDNGRFIVDDEAKWKSIDDEFVARHRELSERLRAKWQEAVKEYHQR